jgi:integrase
MKAHMANRHKRSQKWGKMRQKEGFVYQEKNGNWYARVCYKNSNGKRTSIKRKADNKTHAKQLLKQLIETLDNGGRKAIDAERMTVNDLCDYYAAHYLKPPQYVNGRKIAGLRSFASVGGYIKVFRDDLGNIKLKELNYDDLRTFRNGRLNTSTHQSEQRSLATVNREMAYLRRLLNIAERNGWIDKNPFKKGDALIHTSDEIKRERILSREEEIRLIAECTGYRAHLRPIVIAALDTGCRLGELLKLTWSDIDFAAGLITIQAFNTKTMRERQVSITSRLRSELEILLSGKKDNDDLVFGIKTEVRQGFRNACLAAGFEGVRFHDLRHTHASRLDDLGFSLAKIGGQLGHTVVQTTLRYVNRDKSAIHQVANALDSFNAEVVKAEEVTQFVN